MILRNEINEKLIITSPIAESWWETNIYQITDEGLIWLKRSDSHSESQAKSKHQFYIDGYSEERERHTCKYCLQPAWNYDGLMKEWLCRGHFDLYVKERA